MKPTRLEYLAITGTARAINPLLAVDAKVDFAPIFKGLTTKNFKARKPTIVSDVKKAIKGKTIAQDASVEHLAHMLDQFEGPKGAESLDESVSEEQHKAMEAAAHGKSNLGIPKKVGEEFSEKDAGKGFDRKAFDEWMKSKGASEDSMKRVRDSIRDELPENALDGDWEDDDEGAEDESEEEREAREKREGKGAEDETEEEREEREKKEKEAKDKRAKDAKAKDARAKDGKQGRDRRGAMDSGKTVTVDEMNRAIEAAVAKTVTSNRETEEAREFVRPWVGKVPLALDSAEKILRSAAIQLQIDGAETIHPSALKTIIKMQPVAGAQPGFEGTLSMDSASSGAKGFAERFPESSRITNAI